MTAPTVALLLIAVPAALLADALLDPDKRSHIGDIGPFWIVDLWDRVWESSP